MKYKVSKSHHQKLVKGKENVAWMVVFIARPATEAILSRASISITLKY